MTVYVDDMYKTQWGKYRGMKMSHMIATDDAELHAMAKRIGVRRQWYQGDHYDVSFSKRAEAITHGAIAIGMRELTAMAYLRRCGAEMGDPATAVERMLARKRVEQHATMEAKVNMMKGRS